MTAGAQQALRRTMEIYSNTTRFALACNLSSKIIEPIQSRCAIVRFSRLSDSEILDRLLRVVEAEKVFPLHNISSYHHAATVSSPIARCKLDLITPKLYFNSWKIQNIGFELHLFRSTSILFCTQLYFIIVNLANLQDVDLSAHGVSRVTGGLCARGAGGSSIHCWWGYAASPKQFTSYLQRVSVRQSRQCFQGTGLRILISIIPV